MRAEYYAHSLKDRPVKDWERLEDHLAAVAKLAKTFAAKFGAAEWGELAGLWHDLGKYQEVFQRRLNGEQIHAPRDHVQRERSARARLQLAAFRSLGGPPFREAGSDDRSECEGISR